jgi:hypothetical protein
MSMLVLHDMPTARASDLQDRMSRGDLTAAERLAVAILRGGEDGESSVMAAIDAAQEEYGCGYYRIPVRVVADRSRIMVVATIAHKLPRSAQAQIVRDLETAFKKEPLPNFVVIDGGMKVEIFEVAEPLASAVVLKQRVKDELDESVSG